MNLPFTFDQFLDVFRRYNEAVWPTQWILALLAVTAVVAVIAGGDLASRAASGILALLWLWVGGVYDIGFFRSINPAAVFFGAAFILEGLLIAWLGVARGRLRFRPHRGLSSIAGVALLTYSLVAYPMIGYAAGHRYPLMPTFGVPCPTTIFAFGMFLLCAPTYPRLLLIIPVGWSVLGAVAAVQLGMWEDLGLVAAAVIVVIIALATRGESGSLAHVFRQTSVEARP